MRGARLLAGVATAALSVALVAAPSAPARPLFGFNEDWLAPRQAIQASTPFRPTVQRLQLHWGLIERARGSYDWTSFDRAYGDMTAQGAPPIALVMGTPCWAVADPTCPARTNMLYRVPPGHLPDWERFVGAVVRRYPRLVAVEVWNEPNFGMFNYPLPEVSGYLETLARAYAAVKRERADLPVLGGSLAPITTRRRARRDGGFPRRPPRWQPYARFLRRMLALGADEHMDALAFHAYPNFAPYLKQRRRGAGVRRGFRTGVRRDLRKQIRTVRRIQRAYEAEAPIWVTETGVCTTGPRERRVSALEQAAAVRQTYLTLERLKVRAIVTHRLLDVQVPGAPANYIEHGCGLTDVSGRRKPAWETLRRLRAGRRARRR